MKAILALEDGMIWHGEARGGTGPAQGEVCFNTSMTGYQEVLTDPSYRGQIVTMTYPLIGNYGVNEMDGESSQPQVAGFIVRELSSVTSNWRSQESLEDYLKRHNIACLSGIDTRSLTKHLRVRGALRGVITSEKISDKAAIDLARSWSYLGRDFVEEVTCKTPYLWDEEDTLSQPWGLVHGAREKSGDSFNENENSGTLPRAKHFVIAYDYGLKRNILRRLRQSGFKVKVVPARTSAEKVLAENPDGVFLSNGPGDPEALTYAHETVRKLLGKKPIFGICLGHQILGFAFGGKTYKLKFGHRGGNQPVQDLMTKRVSITSQNHGFAVDPASLPESEVELTHVNLNDGTCEGMRHRHLPVFSVQYHPEAAPGPHDATYFFSQFSQMIEVQKEK